MAARAAPRTITALANFEIKTRSDYATYLSGVDNIAGQLALDVLATADDMYRRLAAQEGGGYAAKQRAWRATRPLRQVSAELRHGGKGALRAFRVYSRLYADLITPKKKKGSFDHKT